MGMAYWKTRAAAIERQDRRRMDAVASTAAEKGWVRPTGDNPSDVFAKIKRDKKPE